MNSRNGSKKYMNSSERFLFAKEARLMPIDEQLFFLVILETGCRISEALNLKANHIDLSCKVIHFETLKRRKSGIFRTVPISDSLIRKLSKLKDRVSKNTGSNSNLWVFSRTTAYRMIRSAMYRAGIHGIHANARGLRHGFAVAALESGIPITLVQRWLGHANLKTTAIYAEVSGAEERGIASRMWRRRRGGCGRAAAEYHAI